MTISLHKFYFDAILRAAKTKHERYGQAMFNHLAEVRPELANRVKEAGVDPFYCDSPNHPKVDAFTQFIESNWNRDLASSRENEEGVKVYIKSVFETRVKRATKEAFAYAITYVSNRLLIDTNQATKFVEDLVEYRYQDL